MPLCGEDHPKLIARINRIEGGLLLVGYFTYCVWLVKPEWLGR